MRERIQAGWVGDRAGRAARLFMVSAVAFAFLAGTSYGQFKKAGKSDCGSGGASKPLTIDPTTTEYPQWSCPSTTVDMEPVWVGKALQCNFEVTNKGKADLKLKIGRS